MRRLIEYETVISRLFRLPASGVELTERIAAEARQVYEKMTGMLSELTC